MQDWFLIDLSHFPRYDQENDQEGDVPCLQSSHKSLAGEQLCSTAPVTPATCSVLCLFLKV